jgi:hypothetical protein
MITIHGNSVEKSGWILIASLETHRGCLIQPAKKQSGFNGLSTSQSGNLISSASGNNYMKNSFSAYKIKIKESL